MAQGARSPVFEHGRDFDVSAAAQGAHALFQAPTAESALESADFEGAAALEFADDLRLYTCVVASGRIAQLYEAVGAELTPGGKAAISALPRGAM